MASRQRPTQAVVFAGGLGTRLRPLTDTKPKPMIEFHGKPFLEYVLQMAREQGIQRVLLLLGYLPEQIQQYFGDGSRFGLSIEYAITAVEDDTGRRLRLAKDRLDPTFLLLVCDNYWPMRLDRMWEQFERTGVKGLVAVYDNADDYTRDNIKVDGQGFATAYDLERRAGGLKGVEIGFGIFDRSVVDLIPDENVPFEPAVFAGLIAQRQLQAYPTGHRYYSTTSLERLPVMERFLARTPAVIVDRDGTLNRSPGSEYVRSWAEWQWLPGSLEALRLLRQAGYRVILVSNQAGIGRGLMSEADLRGIHEKMLTDISQAGGAIDAIYYCPHNRDSTCACRKPKPGMLYQAQREFHLDLTRTPFLGDDERDGQAADAAGCPWLQVTESRSLLDVVKQLLADGPQSAVIRPVVSAGPHAPMPPVGSAHPARTP